MEHHKWPRYTKSPHKKSIRIQMGVQTHPRPQNINRSTGCGKEICTGEIDYFRSDLIQIFQTITSRTSGVHSNILTKKRSRACLASEAKPHTVRQSVVRLVSQYDGMYLQRFVLWWLKMFEKVRNSSDPKWPRSLERIRQKMNGDCSLVPLIHHLCSFRFLGLGWVYTRLQIHLLNGLWLGQDQL